MIYMAAVIKLLHISAETEEHELETTKVLGAMHPGLYGQVLCAIRAVHRRMVILSRIIFFSRTLVAICSLCGCCHWQRHRGSAPPDM